MGVILIGMPGMEKRLSRYPQLYSRVGFAHHYRPLQGDELTFVLTRHWLRLGLGLDDFTDAQAVASIAQITGGDFRLLHRLFVQIGRICPSTPRERYHFVCTRRKQRFPSLCCCAHSGLGGLLAPAKLGAVDPHAVQDDRELARDCDLGTRHTAALHRLFRQRTGSAGCLGFMN